MGQQIIRQPDGRYAVWSSVCDNFLITDATREEIIQCRIQSASIDITEAVNKECDKLDRGEKPHYQFTVSWEEALATIKQVHGTDGIESGES